MRSLIMFSFSSCGFFYKDHLTLLLTVSHLKSHFGSFIVIQQIDLVLSDHIKRCLLYHILKFWLYTETNENNNRSKIKLDLLNYFKEFQILIKMFSILFVFFPDITFPVEEYHRKWKNNLSNFHFHNCWLKKRVVNIFVLKTVFSRYNCTANVLCTTFQLGCLFFKIFLFYFIRLDILH
jgi:hypothetical protein